MKNTIIFLCIEDEFVGFCIIMFWWLINNFRLFEMAFKLNIKPLILK